MKFGKALLALAAVLTVATLGGSANAQQVNGSVQGRWDRVDPGNIVAHAMLFNLRDNAMYSVDMRLHGRDHGHVSGTVASLPKPGVPLYQIVGTYDAAPGGHYVINAKIALILAPTDFIGPQVPHVVGTLDCLLDPNPRLFVIDPSPLMGGVPPVTPWHPATWGHVHGRWALTVMLN